MSKATKTAAAKGGPKKSAARSFESELAHLETLVGRLEKGELGLEDALGAFEEGIGLTRNLMKRLDEAEKRIEVLLEREGGGLEARTIDVEDLKQAAKGGALANADEEDETEDEG